MHFKELVTELGIRQINPARYYELIHLNILEIPRIKTRLTERERMLRTPENEIEDQVRLVAKAIKSDMYSRSFHPYAKRLGKLLRWMAVQELYLENYRHDEIAVILNVKASTIRNDIRSIGDIKKRDWWYQMACWEDMRFLITKEWEFYSLSIEEKLLLYEETNVIF